MNITVRVIPHKDQRYDTVGDWVFLSDDHLVIYVSKMGNSIYEFLVAYHEQIEAMLCLQAGIDEKDVTNFDMQFEKERAEGKHDAEVEPGDDPEAPYHVQHVFATLLEKELASQLKVNWSDYEKAIYAL
jgi:hypothetical protein